MTRIRFVAVPVLAAAFVAASATLHASDPVAVYARVDRVVLAPSPEAPTTIQIHGVFSIATPNNPNDYQPAAEGYLYFTAPADDSRARREWNDLKQVAGTKQIVAFGSRYGLRATLRKASDTPANPDAYPSGRGMGLAKVSGETDYAPIRALATYRK